ncbi:hypothetical protein EW146_g6170 [Bondarzewia mesenterica]|uniref:NADAR domain-containing protein n=1 Tax=Bondarzewia mesenterica TaxID=1095465 RepID=A0A4S4LPH3_9AGAM|nr:hypothetical protein EW146_g6170 [Bondarzewia mesenterica]
MGNAARPSRSFPVCNRLTATGNLEPAISLRDTVDFVTSFSTTFTIATLASNLPLLFDLNSGQSSAPDPVCPSPPRRPIPVNELLCSDWMGNSASKNGAQYPTVPLGYPPFAGTEYPPYIPSKGWDLFGRKKKKREKALRNYWYTTPTLWQYPAQYYYPGQIQAYGYPQTQAPIAMPQPQPAAPNIAESAASATQMPAPITSMPAPAMTAPSQWMAPLSAPVIPEFSRREMPHHRRERPHRSHHRRHRRSPSSSSNDSSSSSTTLSSPSSSTTYRPRHHHSRRHYRNPLPPPPKDVLATTPYRALLPELPSVRGEYWRSFPAALDPYSHHHPLHREGTLGTYADRDARQEGGLFRSWRKRRKREREQGSLAEAAAMLRQTGFVPTYPESGFSMPQPETVQPQPTMPAPQMAPTPGASPMPMPMPTSGIMSMPAGVMHTPDPGAGVMQMPMPAPLGESGQNPVMLTPGPSMHMPGAGTMPMPSPSQGAVPMPSPSGVGLSSGSQPIRISGHSRYSDFLHNSPHRILYEDELYPTALHLFEALKFAETRPDISERIREAGRPEEVFAISRAADNLTRPDWQTVAIGKMDDVLYLKFRQHADLRAMLFDTGNATLIYAEPNDHFWGEGPMGQGQNQLGQSLMRVRDRLRAELSA